MNRNLIGLLFIAAGLVYGSMALDVVYNHTLGWLVENSWVGKETLRQAAKEKPLLGPKSSILLYSLALIIIGLFILWNQNS